MNQDGDLETIPGDWSVKSLAEVCSMRSGGTPPKSDHTLWAGSLPWVSGKDLKAPRLRDAIDHITPEAAEQYSKIAPAGSVLVLVRGMGLANGFALSLLERPMAFNQDLKALTPRDGLLGTFLMYALTHAGTRMLRNVADAAHGTKRLSQDDLDTFNLPIPPVEKQRAIAEVLDRCHESIDVEAAAERVASELKRAALARLFTCGLRDSAQKQTEFGAVPESWDEAVLESVATIQTGVAKGRKFTDSDMIDVPYLRVANVQDGHLDLSEIKTIQIRRTELARYRLQDGDVVLTEGGDFDKLGRGFIWRGEVDLCVHQNHVFAVRPQRSRLLPDFFAYLAQSAYGKAYFLQVAHKTTNLACINTTKLKAFPVVLPPLDEQRDIVSILQALDRKVDLHRRKRTVLERLFKTLLHKLMTGEVRVDDLDLSALEARPTREPEAAA
jgi:type I restriction enzyme, S subunit